jgi:hypothetical protein
MGACRWLYAVLSIGLLMAAPAFAGAPPLAEFSCDIKGARVQTRVDPRQRYFATASPVLTGSTASSNSFEIRVNPERTYLGKATQEWLYLRQCAHIMDRHDVVKGEQGLKLRDEEDADCRAVQELMKKSGGSPRILYSIESDMERVLNDPNRWREVLPGPQRRVQLSSCLRK